MSTRFIDSVITYKILHLLVTPFTETDAYKLGIIDSKGKELKRMSTLHTTKDRDAYTLLHRLVFRLKRIIEKVPVENKKLLSFAAALALIKEELEKNKESIDLEIKFLDAMKRPLVEEQCLLNVYLSENKLVPFKYFYEEAPVNNIAATPGIDSYSPTMPGVGKKVTVRNKRKKFIVARRAG